MVRHLEPPVETKLFFQPTTGRRTRRAAYNTHLGHVPVSLKTLATLVVGVSSRPTPILGDGADGEPRIIALVDVLLSLPQIHLLAFMPMIDGFHGKLCKLAVLADTPTVRYKRARHPLNVYLLETQHNKYPLPRRQRLALVYICT